MATAQRGHQSFCSKHARVSISLAFGRIPAPLIFGICQSLRLSFKKARSLLLINVRSAPSGANIRSFYSTTVAKLDHGLVGRSTPGVRDHTHDTSQPPTWQTTWAAVASVQCVSLPPAPDPRRPVTKHFMGPSPPGQVMPTRTSNAQATLEPNAIKS